MLVRVRSKDGVFRFPLEPTDDVAKLIEKVLEATPTADPATLTFSNQPRGGEMDAMGLKGNTLADLGIAHGHLLYAAYKETAAASQAESSAAGAANGISASAEATATIPITSAARKGKAPEPWETVQEDAVDKYWEAKDGKIPRQKDAKFCRHGDKAMCDYCMPLEPYDAKYQAEHQIKHLSYHAYLKKQDINVNKPSQSYIPPLEEADFTVKSPCPSGQHPPWPAGICTKCQPSAITLQSQPYRMVDHVEFAHPQLIENLLGFWRATSVQRFGFLLGRYEPYADVPMGIKAVVEAISEPPQEGEVDGLTLGVPWEDQPRVERLAKACGLSILGMIYTDLTAADPTLTDPEKAGKVLCKRHQKSFFLSGIETIFAAQLQSANPSPCRFSRSGKFNSKFVTCVISGTEDGGVDVRAFQVSEQGMAMVQADMIEASVKPNIIRVQPSEDKRYVPEVFYRYKNEYKIDVKESAKPTFPVEYLLVNVTHGFPNEPKPTFLSSKFPIENRPGLHDQDMNKALGAVTAAIGRDELLPSEFAAHGGDKDKDKQTREKLVGVLSDWHFVAFVETIGILEQDAMAALCKVAISHDAVADLDALLGQPSWQTLVAIARESAPAPASPGPSTDRALGSASASGSASRGPGSFSTPATGAMATTTTRTTSTSQQRGSGTRDSPIIYNGEDGEDEEFDFNLSGDEDEGMEDDFEDANSDVEVLETAPSSARRSTVPTPTAASAAEPVQIQEDEDDAAGGKTCPHCTFQNPPGVTDSCEICGLPL